MKTIFLFLSVLISVTVQSQIVDRITVEGEVIAPLGDDVQGINIVNTTTREGVITDANGEFRIRVGINDRLEITAIQFQKFTVVVDKGILEQKQLHIFVNESVNQLDEVVVTPYDLSGNIRADIQRVAAGPPIAPPVYSAAAIQDNDYTFSADNQSRLDNVAAGGRRVRGELNFVNVIKSLWKTTHIKIGNKKKFKEDVDFAVRNVHNNQFFKEHLALNEEEITDFIAYAETKGLDDSMLEQGKELDLIQFLMEQGEAYQQR